MASTKGDAVLSGWVMKMPPLTKATKRGCLKRRWLVLWESCHLAYYENERMRKLIKEINLNDCEEIRANFRRKPNEPVIRVDEFAFSVPIRGDGSREFVFIPENQDAMQRWCDKLESMRRDAQSLPPLEASRPAAAANNSPNINRPLPPEPGVSSPPPSAGAPSEHRPYMNEEMFAKTVMAAQQGGAPAPPGLPSSDDPYVKFYMGDEPPKKNPYVNLPSDGPPLPQMRTEATRPAASRGELRKSATVDYPDRYNAAPLSSGQLDGRHAFSSGSRSFEYPSYAGPAPGNYPPQPYGHSMTMGRPLSRPPPPQLQSQFSPPPDYLRMGVQPPRPPPPSQQPYYPSLPRQHPHSRPY
ncbi:uncharacterized protein [Oscarella lobularis]|uniref:uncharacterized protein isoform X1 n=1 Tax=Oscarella lobularis TaxID=121494 RepID=UPI00331310DF